MVLIMVMAALALVAVVASRFAQRIDALRAQTSSLRAHADQRLQTEAALAAGLYLLSTERLEAAGVGNKLNPRLNPTLELTLNPTLNPTLEPTLTSTPKPMLWLDDRRYALPGGGLLQAQDLRGLLPLNAPERATLQRLLAQAGVSAALADQMVDVLADYTDTDSLKRLNGAERNDYQALDLPPPRNDWLLAVRELHRMPVWKDQPAAVALMLRLASQARRPVLNPNTAPLALLAAVFPGASGEQLALFVAQRENLPFRDARAAQLATGLPFIEDEHIFSCGADVRITASAKGSRHAAQYNVQLTPAGRDAPWLISHIQPVPRSDPPDAPDRAEPFPLALFQPRRP